MGDAGDEPEDRAASETAAASEEHAIRHGAGESAERPVLAAEQIVREIERAEDIERTARDADQGDGVVIQHFCQNGTEPVNLRAGDA